jgi:hypothetical protein
MTGLDCLNCPCFEMTEPSRGPCGWGLCLARDEEMPVGRCLVRGESGMPRRWPLGPNAQGAHLFSSERFRWGNGKETTMNQREQHVLCEALAEHGVGGGGPMYIQAKLGPSDREERSALMRSLAEQGVSPYVIDSAFAKLEERFPLSSPPSPPPSPPPPVQPVRPPPSPESCSNEEPHPERYPDPMCPPAPPFVGPAALRHTIEHANWLHYWIEMELIPSRERQIALDKLRECVDWCHHALGVRSGVRR